MDIFKRKQQNMHRVSQDIFLSSCLADHTLLSPAADQHLLQRRLLLPEVGGPAGRVARHAAAA